MARQRHHYTADCKAKVAWAAIKGQQPVNAIAATYGVPPHQVLQWKRQALEVVPDVFSSRRARAAQDEEALHARLYPQIGQLTVELDWLKKKWDCPLERRRHWVEPPHAQLSVRRQCPLRGVNRARLYYQPVDESVEHRHLLRWLDEP